MTSERSSKVDFQYAAKALDIDRADTLVRQRHVPHQLVGHQPRGMPSAPLCADQYLGERKMGIF